MGMRPGTPKRPHRPVFPQRRRTDAPERQSDVYPDAQWPVARPGDRRDLLEQIERDLQAGLLDPIAAYHERLHWAYRCMKEGV